VPSCSLRRTAPDIDAIFRGSDQIATGVADTILELGRRIPDDIGNSRPDEVSTRVTGVARYATFEEMFDHESVASVNPLASREEQLANIRQIYPPEREGLGVVAIGLELVDPPRPT
jgi:ASC-1-like (ASCH) protein